MRICYFGSYNPSYARSRVLLRALRQNGYAVLECNDRSPGFLKYIHLFIKHWRLRGKYDLMMVGFPGQEMMILARILSHRPIVFDAFTSHYGGYVLDRGYFKKDSFRARYYRFLDRRSCQLADAVLLDTRAHINFFVREFRLPPQKFRRLFVGADSSVFYPAETEQESQSIKNRGKFVVHFHGHYIPLQGVEYIIRAAKILEKEGIFFNLIGVGQQYQKIRKLVSELGINNVDFISEVSYENLPLWIKSADICLGIFGNTAKTDLVIPNKVYEGLACGKPVVTADTEAIRELLTDRENILLCNKADPEDLATKILGLKNDLMLRKKIAENGRKLFKEKLTEYRIGRELNDILRACA